METDLTKVQTHLASALGWALSAILGPRQDAILTCPECGDTYETEDGDGGCPRCHDYEEVKNEVLKVLNDLRPQHLENDEIREAVEDGAWRYLNQPRNIPTPTETPRPASTTKEEDSNA